MKYFKAYLSYIIHSSWGLVLTIFMLALGPRVLDLAVFVGPDEFDWLTSSANFSKAINDGDLAQTYQLGHPGVTLMWLETLGRWWQYGLGLASNDIDTTLSVKPIVLLSNARQISAVANSVLVAFIALLVYRIFGLAPAWIAGCLIAFDPFLLTEARMLRTEGLLTSFITVALLSLLLYLKAQHVRYVVMAGFLTGLALLSKISAIVLLPLGMLIIGGAPLLKSTAAFKESWRSALLRLLMWGAVISLTVIVFWPALWVAAQDVALEMYDYVTFRAVKGGNDSDSFFLGVPTSHQDLSPLFYLVALSYRTSSVVWIGLILLILSLWSKNQLWHRTKVSVSVLLLFVALYLVLITGAKFKYDRYLIPILPTLNILAAFGLVTVWIWLVQRQPQMNRKGWLGVTGVILLQIVTAWTYHPYYYTYWNPLFGGVRQALYLLPVGAGEGIEQVSAYLNTLPRAKEMLVASDHREKIGAIFDGQTMGIDDEEGEWFLADYTFLYISQLQRAKHDPQIIQYLQRKPVEFSLTISGLDYGWLYRGPSAQYSAGNPKLEGRAILYAYDLSATKLKAGQTLTTTVYFRNDGQLHTDRFYVRLVDEMGYIWGEGIVTPRPGFIEAAHTLKAIVEGEAILNLPLGMPPGHYILKMGYEQTKTKQLIGEFVLPDKYDNIQVSLPEFILSSTTLTSSQSLKLILQNELALRDYQLGDLQSVPGESVWLTLFWQALRDVQSDYIMNLQLLDSSQREVSYWLGRPVRSSYPTNEWQAHQIVQDPWRLDLPANIVAADYNLRLRVFDAKTQTELTQITLGQLSVKPRQSIFTLPKMQQTLNVNLNHQVTLLGYDLVIERYTTGERPRVILYWQAQQVLNKSYTVFIQLVSLDGTVVVQYEGTPGEGKLPTTTWFSSEIIIDSHPVEFPHVAPGKYKLVAGMYDPLTNIRLSTIDGDVSVLLQTVSLK